MYDLVQQFGWNTSDYFTKELQPPYLLQQFESQQASVGLGSKHVV